MSDTARQAWKRWWDDEGSGIQPSIAQSDEDFARYITEIAWSNGAYARYADIDRLRAELAAAIKQRDNYRSALERIANQDYRGNRSTESQIAFSALAEMRKEGGGA